MTFMFMIDSVAYMSAGVELTDEWICCVLYRIVPVNRKRREALSSYSAQDLYLYLSIVSYRMLSWYVRYRITASDVYS
jgi:hypothetical protein